MGFFYFALSSPNHPDTFTSLTLCKSQIRKPEIYGRAKMKLGSTVDSCASAQFPKKLDASANAAAAITVAASADDFWVIDWVAYSYSAAPTGGKLTIAFGGVTVFEQDIVDGGAGFLPFTDAPLYVPAQTKNEALVITLAAGGSGIIGKVTARIR